MKNHKAMKKNYIQPELTSYIVVTGAIINASAEYTSESAEVDENGGLKNDVKGNSYNVWDDDWSKN